MRRFPLLVSALAMTQIPAFALLASGVRLDATGWAIYATASVLAAICLFVMALGCWARMERIVQLVRGCVEHVQQGNAPVQPDKGSVENVQASLTCLEDAVRNLERDATRDPLTSAYNRRCCASRLDADLARAARDGSAFSIAIFDLDGLKDVNDRLGHAAGDAALRHLATVLQESVREGDWVARWGGDEFLIGFWDADEEAARGAVARIEAELRKRPLTLGKERENLSACSGFAQAMPNEVAADLFVRADAALLALKRKRRERS